MAIAPKPPDKSDLVLTTGLPAGSYELEDYRPASNLFLLFAHTPDTQDGIKRFADQYGLLGEELPIVVAPAPRATKKRIKGSLGSGELLSVWQHQIREMRQAVELWSDLREVESGDATKLSRHVQWHGKKLIYYDSHPHLPLPPLAIMLGIPAPARRAPGDQANREDGLRTLAVIASQVINSEWLKRFRVGDCMVPARYYLQKLVNEHLQGKASPKLLWKVRDNQPHSLALFFVAENLLGLMWLQLAEAINGNRQYRQCAACKTWMLLSHEDAGSRSSRRTCSAACRMKVYYRRKVEARILQEQGGLSVEQIAERLNADQQTVSAWLAMAAKALGGTQNIGAKPEDGGQVEPKNDL